MQAANMFSSAQVSKSFWFTVSHPKNSKSYRFILIFPISHAQPVPPVLPFHFAPSGNRKLRGKGFFFLNMGRF